MTNLTTGQLIDALHRVRTAAAAGYQDAARDLPLVEQAALRDPNISKAVAQFGHGPVDMGPQTEPEGAGEAAARAALAPFGAANAGIDRTVGGLAGQGARLAGAVARDTHLSSNPNAPSEWQAATEHKFAPPAPISPLEGDIRGAVGELASYPYRLVEPLSRSIEAHLPATVNRIGADYLAPAANLAAALAGGLDALPETAEPASLVARAPAHVAEEAGYSGLKSKADLKTPGSTKITNQLIAKDVGLPEGQVLNRAAVENAMKSGPARVYDAVQAALPEKLTQSDALRGAIENLQGQVSQLPKSPDVEALKQSMLEQPTMTREQLFANIRDARARAADLLASDQPNDLALGRAYADLAGAYEDFAGANIPKDAGVTLQDFQNARTQFAKGNLAIRALKGGENIDPAVYARIAAKPETADLLSGNARIVGQTLNNLPADSGANLTRAIGALGGGVVTEALGHQLGIPGAGISGTVAGGLVAPAIRESLTKLATRGDPEAAASTATSPELSYFFRGNEPEPGWNRTSVPGPTQSTLPLNPALELRAPEGAVGQPVRAQPPVSAAPEQYALGLNPALQLTAPPGRVLPRPLAMKPQDYTQASLGQQFQTGE